MCMYNNKLTDFPLLLLLLAVVVVIDVVVPTVAMSHDYEVDEEEAVVQEDLSYLLLPFTGPQRSSKKMSPGI